MTRMNWSRLILGGLIAGVIIDVFEYVTNGMILADQWAKAMKAIGKPEDLSGLQIVALNIWGLAMGVLALWLYAAIRPRFGAGLKTAICAGVVAWALGYVMGSAGDFITPVLPRHLLAISIAVGLVEMIVATLAGAYFYRERQWGNASA
jgi:hypothetical protein